MAGARAAASLSLTISVALVTVLIVGGILAGPTILDCSHQPGTFGACLRDRLDHSRLVPGKDEPSQVPVLSSELSAPSLPEPPSRQADLGHADGWLDARANEYVPPATSALEPPALSSLPEQVTAAPLPVVPASSLVAEIEPSAPPPLPPLIAPAPAAPVAEKSSSAVAVIEFAPPHPRPVVTSKPKADVQKKPVAKPARVARLAPKAPPRPTVRTFKNDPRFPNVTVLPPPATGANSSFATLETN